MLDVVWSKVRKPRDGRRRTSRTTSLAAEGGTIPGILDSSSYAKPLPEDLGNAVAVDEPISRKGVVRLHVQIEDTPDERQRFTYALRFGEARRAPDLQHAADLTRPHVAADNLPRHGSWSQFDSQEPSHLQSRKIDPSEQV